MQKQEGGIRLKNTKKEDSDKLPLFSIITVVYNSENDIEKTIQSVIAQKYKNMEYLIIDGGSKDKTVDIIKKYNDKIDYWISESDKSLYDAMNRGIDLCNGRGHLFLNAGDYIVGDIFHPNYNIPCFIPVLRKTIFGKEKILKPLVYLRNRRMPYCHNGILFKTDKSKKYDLRFKLAGDWYYSAILHDLSKAKLVQTNGYIVFSRGGLSDIKHEEAKNEVLAISKEFQPFYIYIQLVVFELICILLKRVIMFSKRLIK